MQPLFNWSLKSLPCTNQWVVFWLMKLLLDLTTSSLFPGHQMKPAVLCKYGPVDANAQTLRPAPINACFAFDEILQNSPRNTDTTGFAHFTQLWRSHFKKKLFICRCSGVTWTTPINAPNSAFKCCWVTFGQIEIQKNVLFFIVRVLWGTGIPGSKEQNSTAKTRLNLCWI